jgi:co-chaperonin GroES (HSP10)
MIPKLEDCKPGLKPVGYNVLVALDVLEEVTAGGIILPTKHTERENSASERGRIVDVSPMAFKGGDWEAVEAPSSGTVVLFQRYAGTEVEGDDGKQYRLVADTDLKGIFNG